MKNSILYFIMSIGLLVLGSCSTGSFVSDTGRFNYVKTDKPAEQYSPQKQEVSDNVQKHDAVNHSVESVADNNIEAEHQNQSESAEKAVTKTSPVKNEVAANSIAEEEELIEKSYSKASSHKRSLINIPSPDQTTKEKSQLTALLLCLILGMIGVHRFYLGKPLGGIIILVLTLVGIAYPPALALAGLIVLVDAVRLLFGGLGPGW